MDTLVGDRCMLTVSLAGMDQMVHALQEARRLLEPLAVGGSEALHIAVQDVVTVGAVWDGDALVATGWVWGY